MKLSELKAALFYARRDIVKNKKVFIFITAAIIFATANIIIVNGFMDGIANDLVSNSIETSIGHLNIYPGEDDRFIEGVGFKEKKLSSMDEVVAFSSRLYASGTLSFRDKATAVNIIALDATNEKRVTNLLEKLDRGNTLEANDRDILISFRLAEDMGADAGDDVQVVFENGASQTYRIKGITHTGSYELDVNTVFMAKAEANSRLGFDDKPSMKPFMIMILAVAKAMARIMRAKTRIFFPVSFFAKKSAVSRSDFSPIPHPHIAFMMFILLAFMAGYIPASIVMPKDTMDALYRR